MVYTCDYITIDYTNQSAQSRNSRLPSIPGRTSPIGLVRMRKPGIYSHGSALDHGNVPNLMAASPIDSIRSRYYLWVVYRQITCVGGGT